MFCGVRQRALRAPKQIHRLSRIFESGTHLLENRPGEVVRFEFKLRSTPPGEQRVPVQVMSDLVGHDADGSPVGSRPLTKVSDKELAIQNQPSSTVNGSGRIGHTCRLYVEVRNQSNSLDDSRDHVLGLPV